MADYPTTIFEQREIENVPGVVYDASKKTRVYAEDLVALGDEVTAIETTLGENVQGSYDTLAERLDDFSGGAWGAITGNILDQTDLQTEFAAVPYENVFTKLCKALGSVLKAALPTNYFSGSTGLFTFQQLQLKAVYLEKPATITGVSFLQAVQGAYTAQNYSGFGLYTYVAGVLTLVASSTNDTALFKQAGGAALFKKAFSATYAAAAGVYYIGMLWDRSAQTTAPQVFGKAWYNAAHCQLDFTNSAKLNMTLNSQTSLPSPLNASACTASLNDFDLSLY